MKGLNSETQTTKSQQRNTPTQLFCVSFSLAVLLLLFRGRGPLTCLGLGAICLVLCVCVYDVNIRLFVYYVQTDLRLLTGRDGMS